MSTCLCSLSGVWLTLPLPLETICDIESTFHKAVNMQLGMSYQRKSSRKE